MDLKATLPATGSFHKTLVIGDWLMTAVAV
jgi:hypothetical protein